jgi:hypothetical protein
MSNREIYGLLAGAVIATGLSIWVVLHLIDIYALN